MASLVLFSHAFPLTGRSEPITQLTGGITGGAIAVVGFFFISGFLVTLSWLRLKSPLKFVVHRIFRIWPALLIALVFGALLGVFVSEADSPAAWASAWHYIAGNLPLVMGIQFHIEGAFVNNPNTGINGSLWTLEWELFCYIALCILGVLGGLSGRIRPFFTTIGIMLAIHQIASYDLTYFRDSVEIALILFTFALGALSYFIHDRFGGITLVVVLFSLSALSFLLSGDLKLIVPVFVISGVIAFISFAAWLPDGDARNDTSYGIYIYAFPVQQWVVWFYPECGPYENMFIAFPIVYLLALLSWRYVEKPMILQAKLLFKRGKADEEVPG